MPRPGACRGHRFKARAQKTESQGVGEAQSRGKFGAVAGVACRQTPLLQKEALAQAVMQTPGALRDKTAKKKYKKAKRLQLSRLRLQVWGVLLHGCPFHRRGHEMWPAGAIPPDTATPACCTLGSPRVVLSESGERPCPPCRGDSCFWGSGCGDAALCGCGAK